MTFDEYWQQLTSKNAGLADPDTVMRISVAAFKSQLEKAWHKAKEQGKDRAADLFEQITGKRNPFGF